jgi:ParB family chromosome partitioning protein
MRLLKLDPIIQTGMRDGFLSMGHGRALINIEEAEKQLEVYEKIVSQGLSVRATEMIVKNIKEKKRVKTFRIQPELYESTISIFGAHFNTRISVKGNETERGSIHIHFDSHKELNQILKKIDLED